MITILKKNFKKIIFSIVVILIILGGFYYFYKKNNISNSPSMYLIGRVKKSILSDELSYSGQIISNNQVDLKSLVSGNISYIGSKNGNFINKGKIILSVSSYDAQKQVRDAELSLKQSKLNLDNLSNPLDDYNKKLLENNIQTEEQNIKISKTNYLNSNLQLNPLYSFSTNLPILSGSYNCDKEGKYIFTYNGQDISFSGLEDGYILVNYDTPRKIGNCGLYLTLKSGVNYVVNSSWELNIPNNLSNNYINTKTQYENNLANSQNKITQYKAQLNKESVTNFDLSSAKLNYEQKLNSLADAKYNLSNYSIVAPFDGILTSFTSNAGDYISQGSKIGTIATSKKIIKVFINETDISKVKLRQKTKISIDSISDINILGEVIDIDILPTTDGGVINYGVSVAIDSNDERLKIGLTTNISIKIKETEELLNIPSQSIKSDINGKYVEVLDNQNILELNKQNFINASNTKKRNFNGGRNNSTSTFSTSTINSSSTRSGKIFSKTIPVLNNTTHKVYVTTGVVVGENTEILSGLNEGDMIVINTIIPSKSSNSTQSNSISSLLSGNRGGVGGGNNRGGQIPQGR